MAQSIVGVDFDYTYNGKLSTELFFTPTVNTPAINTLFNIRPSFKYKEKISLVPMLENIVKKYASCGRSFTDGIDITNTSLDITQLEVNMEWCKDDFEETLAGNILSEEWLKSGVNEFNPEGTPIRGVIDELVLDGMRRDTFRILSFSDTSDADTNWNQIEGLWPKLLANDGPGLSYCVQAPVIDLGTTALSAGQALSTLQTVYESSQIILKQMPNNMKYFAVTGTIFENLLASYEANVNGTERQFTLLQAGPADANGMPTLNYRGISIMPIYAWDDALNKPGNPLFGTIEHLVLYTTKANHAVGFDVASDAEKIEGWYERKDRKFYIEGFYRMGYNYIHCDLQTIAY